MATVTQLANGITRVTEQRPGCGKVVMNVGFGRGAYHDDPQQAGLTNLMHDSCWGGTRTRSRLKIAKTIESFGGQTDGGTDKYTTVFSAIALTRFTTETFDILADVILNPAFKPSEVRKTKTQIKQELDRAQEEPDQRAEDAFYKACYAEQTASKGTEGEKEDVDRHTIEQIKSLHAEILSHPQDMVITFTGDIAPEEAEKLSQKYFGHLTGSPRLAAEPLIFKDGDIRIEEDIPQLNLEFGFKAPSNKDPSRIHFLLLAQILSGGMSSPLFIEIREKRGLVYHISANYKPSDAGGVFVVGAGTGKGNAAELMKTTLDLLGKFAREGFSEESIMQARESIMRKMDVSLESLSATGSKSVGQILKDKKLTSNLETRAELESVTAEDIRKACLSLLENNDYALGAVGPLDGLPSQTEIKDMIRTQIPESFLPSTATHPAALSRDFVQSTRAPIQSEDAPRTSILPNGLRVISMTREGSLTCGAWVGAGSDHETPELNGATHMNEHMMFKGTPSYGPGTIDKIIEKKFFGELNAYTSKDETAYYFYNLDVANIDEVADICGEMVFRANIAEEEFDGKNIMDENGHPKKERGERDVVIEEIKMYAANTIANLIYQVYELGYPDQPHGRPVIGTESTIRAMDTEMLRNYRDRYYSSNNVVFAAAGPISHEDFVELATRKFGHLQPMDFPTLPKPIRAGGTKFREMNTAEVCTMAYALEAPAKNDPDVWAYNLLAHMLGGGESSRIHQALVDRTSLSLMAGSQLMSHRNISHFLLIADSSPENARTVASTLMRELNAISTTATNAELRKVKIQREMGLISTLEKNQAICRGIAADGLSQGYARSPAEVAATINAVTLKDIKRVARKLLEQNPVLSMIVPQGTDPALLPTHQDVLSYRDQTSSTMAPPKAKTGFGALGPV